MFKVPISQNEVHVLPSKNLLVLIEAINNFHFSAAVVFINLKKTYWLETPQVRKIVARLPDILRV